MKNYGETLKEHRLARGLTFKDIENKTGINNGNLSRWERDEVLPNIDSCVQLAEFYGISIDELLGISDSFDVGVATSMGDSLTSEERDFISKFRTLPDKIKKTIRDQIEVYSEPNELLPKTNKKV